MKKRFPSFLAQKPREDWPGAWKAIHRAEGDVPPLAPEAEERILAELKAKAGGSIKGRRLRATRRGRGIFGSQASRSVFVGLSGIAAAGLLFFFYFIFGPRSFHLSPPESEAGFTFHGQPVRNGEIVRAKENLVYLVGGRRIVVVAGSLVRFEQGIIDLREGSLYYESPHQSAAESEPTVTPPRFEAGGLRLIPLGTRAILKKDLDRVTLAVLEGGFRVMPGDQVVHEKEVLDGKVLEGGPRKIVVRPMGPGESLRFEAVARDAIAKSDTTARTIFSEQSPSDRNSVELDDGRILFGTVKKEGGSYVLEKEGRSLVLPARSVRRIVEMVEVEEMERTREIEKGSAKLKKEKKIKD